MTMTKAQKNARLKMIKRAHKKVMREEKKKIKAAQKETRRLMRLAQKCETTQTAKDIDMFSEENMFYKDVDRYVRESTDIYDNYKATDTDGDWIR
jgi:hypothetical protein